MGKSTINGNFQQLCLVTRGYFLGDVLHQPNPSKSRILRNLWNLTGHWEHWFCPRKKHSNIDALKWWWYTIRIHSHSATLIWTHNTHIYTWHPNQMSILGVQPGPTSFAPNSQGSSAPFAQHGQPSWPFVPAAWTNKSIQRLMMDQGKWHGWSWTSKLMTIK